MACNDDRGGNLRGRPPGKPPSGAPPNLPQYLWKAWARVSAQKNTHPTVAPQAPTREPVTTLPVAELRAKPSAASSTKVEANTIFDLPHHKRANRSVHHALGVVYGFGVTDGRKFKIGITVSLEKRFRAYKADGWTKMVALLRAESGAVAGLYEWALIEKLRGLPGLQNKQFGDDGPETDQPTYVYLVLGLDGKNPKGSDGIDLASLQGVENGEGLPDFDDENSSEAEDTQTLSKNLQGMSVSDKEIKLPWTASPTGKTYHDAKFCAGRYNSSSWERISDKEAKERQLQPCKQCMQK